MQSIKKYVLVVCSLLLAISCSEDDKISPVKMKNDILEHPACKGSFVSVNMAAEVAASFYDKALGKSSTRSSSEPSAIKAINEDGAPLMYVFNYPDGGFVIVSATKDYYPILAYSDESCFDTSAGIGGVTEWIKSTKNAILSNESLNDSVKTEIKALWESLIAKDYSASLKASTRSELTNAEIACYMRCEDLLNQYGYEGDQGWHFCPLSDAQQVFEDAGFSGIYQSLCYSAEFNHSTPSTSVLGWKICTVKRKVGPLITTNWHQNSPFNDLCDGCPAGCGPIAFAQILKYYQYPASFTYNGHTFGWNTIPTAPDANSDQAALVRIVGSFLETSYHSNYSFVTPGDMEDGIENCGFDVSVEDHLPFEVECEVMYSRRPVIMLGNDDNLSFLPGSLQYIGSSHYWICDGGNTMTLKKLFLFTEWQPYGNGNFVPGWNSIDDPYDFGGVTYTLLHMNWGWGGKCNGWFGSCTTPGYGYRYDNNYFDNSSDSDFEHSRKDFYIRRRYN